MSIVYYRPEGSRLGLEENCRHFTPGGLEEACLNGTILEAMVTHCERAERLTVDLGVMKGIIEREEVQYSPTGEPIRDIAVITRVGKAVCFKVLGFFYENGERVARLSRRAAQRACYENFLCDLIPGDVIDAKITHLESFGAFVDIGCGVISLLSIDCISVSRISHPSDRFRVGEYIRVVIKSIERDTFRIFVTHKELLGTWEENAALFSVGQTVAGIVRSIEDYGIFVELTPNLAGLAEYRTGITVGQTAAVYIKNIMPERMKLKLVLIDSYRGEGQVHRRVVGYPPETTHIDAWHYSPLSSKRCIETVFEQKENSLLS